ncbi:MAG: 16S rRNA (cytosine(1402)-N(4))-methyltransferase RsmH [Alphaproteobacteria bacterium]
MTAPAPQSFSHCPVMLAETLEALRPRDGGVYLDGTFGDGGYTRAILEKARCRVIAVDRDPVAVARGQAMAEVYDGRLAMTKGRFGDMDALLEGLGVGAVDGIALDLGVSSMQIDDADRGFSFSRDGDLDMRMECEGQGAAEAVNGLPETELARIFHAYGEERMARRVARAIVTARTEAPITRTARLAAVIRSVVRSSPDGIDPATRSFQGLRIYVNDEMGELDRGLACAERLLSPGGRLVVVAFHSLEDRAVKTFLRERSGRLPRPSRHLPEMGESDLPTFALLTPRALRPSPGETATNPRARSARLRAAERTSAPAWPSPSNKKRGIR